MITHDTLGSISMFPKRGRENEGRIALDRGSLIPDWRESSNHYEHYNEGILGHLRSKITNEGILGHLRSKITNEGRLGHLRLGNLSLVIIIISLVKTQSSV